jgi:recombination protein RecA
MAATAGTTGAKKAPAKKRTTKKKAPEKPSRQDRASSVVADLKARYPGRIFRGHEYTSPWLLKRLPTGILPLDIALMGGLPAGGMTMIIGPPGIGKNWLANQVIAAQQGFKGEDCNIAIVSTEMVYDKTLARACDIAVGLSEEEIAALDRGYFSATDTHLTDEYKDECRLEIGTFLTVPPGTAEEAFDIALDLVASREFDVVLIDSFGSLLTEEDEEKDMQDASRVGGASAVNTRFARKLSAVYTPDAEGNPNMTCLIGINQVRDNMDRANKYSPKTKETGGWALKHARWVTIELSHAGKHKEKVKGKERVIGKTIRWKITKQKAGGAEGSEGTYDFIWKRVGVRRPMETLRAAVDAGVVEKAGSWYSYGDDRIGQGMDNASAYIEEHDLLREIETATLRAAGVKCNYIYDHDAS